MKFGLGQVLNRRISLSQAKVYNYVHKNTNMCVGIGVLKKINQLRK
jgi:hypothetical protein